MSYDLFFFAPKGRTLGRQAWSKYAAGMPLTRWTDETRVLYENLNTSVYCAFDYSEPVAEETDARNAADTGLGFNLNYARPSFFALESMPLVEKVCADLGLLVVDPQSEDGQQPKAPRAEELIASWNEGNLLTSRQVAQYSAQGALKGADAVSYLPPQRGLEFWNYRRRQPGIKEQFSGHAEASLILVRPTEQPEAFRLLAWQQSDEIWLLPVCDLVRIVKRMSILGAFPKDVEMVVPWSEVARALGDLPRPIASDPDVNFISAELMPEARHRLGRLSGRPFARYQRVRPDHCIEVALG